MKQDGKKLVAKIAIIIVILITIATFLLIGSSVVYGAPVVAQITKLSDVQYISVPVISRKELEYEPFISSTKLNEKQQYLVIVTFDNYLIEYYASWNRIFYGTKVFDLNATKFLDKYAKEIMKEGILHGHSDNLTYRPPKTITRIRFLKVDGPGYKKHMFGR